MLPGLDGSIGMLLLLLLVAQLVLLLWLAFRRRAGGDTAALLASQTDVLRSAQSVALDRIERELRDELGRQAQAHRSDVAALQQVLLTQSGDVARTQNEQIDSFRTQLAAM
ncbi:MAG: hypothetical protein ACKVQR_02130, partial [Aquabacterium sp.]